MAKIFISSTTLFNNSLGDLFFRELQRKHEILRRDVQPGNDWQLSIKEAIKESNVFIAFITQDYIKSDYTNHELGYLISYAENNKRKLFIPIVIGSFQVPFEIQKYRYLQINPGNLAPDITDTIEKINNAIVSHEARVAADEEVASEKKAIIEKNAATYVEEAISELKKREGELLKKARFWYVMGYGPLGVGFIASALFSYFTFSHFEQTSSAWDLVTFTAIKSVVLIGLLLAMAKYSVSLAKSYMEESLKNADRIHAISFGKFYLQSFGENAERNDIKEVFQHWNISGKNSFSSQNLEIIDPKILETAFELAKTMVGKNVKNP